ncbi:hypothetical protein [Gilvimarinus chinensis]|uniref:hypothetical protein n=1 Tax=Gilvimarinus chinensis TaxID=396005 RepID=UPI000475DA78|nr:hypothetical protein [Gilvimarinus chinensis]
MKLRIPHSLILLPFMFSGAVNAAQSTVGSDLYQKENINAQQVPAQALEAVQKLAPGFQFQEAEQETKHGNQYLDLEGVTSTGEEIEFDMLLNADSVWEVVEIQKDLQLENTPPSYKTCSTKPYPTNSPHASLKANKWTA